MLLYSLFLRTAFLPLYLLPIYPPKIKHCLIEYFLNPLCFLEFFELWKRRLRRNVGRMKLLYQTASASNMDDEKRQGLSNTRVPYQKTPSPICTHNVYSNLYRHFGTITDVAFWSPCRRWISVDAQRLALQTRNVALVNLNMRDIIKYYVVSVCWGQWITLPRAGAMRRSPLYCVHSEAIFSSSPARNNRVFCGFTFGESAPDLFEKHKTRPLNSNLIVIIIYYVILDTR